MSYSTRNGAIHTDSGISSFPEGGVWSADDRILAFATGASGGLAHLVYHGHQPQSANSFLFRGEHGALILSIELHAGEEVREVAHRFERVRVLPYGWENEFAEGKLRIQTALVARGHSLTWQVRCLNDSSRPVRATPVLRLDHGALNWQVNGLREWRAPEAIGGALLVTAHDRLQTGTWISFPGFRDVMVEAETALLLAGETTEVEVPGDRVRLLTEELAPGAWGRTRYFFIVCAGAALNPGSGAGRDVGETAREDARNLALTRLAGLRAAPGQAQTEQAKRYAQRIATAPRLQVTGYPVAQAVYRLAPVYLDAAKVGQTGAMRSSSGGYYFVWGWDSLMAGHELARLGDAEGTRRLLDFIGTHLAEDGSVPHRYDNDLQALQVTGYGFIDLLLISLLYQYYAETLDHTTLDRAYSLARRIFGELAARCDDRGFYPSLGMYPDAPQKLGRTPQSYVGYEVGFWYCACRMMEALARISGEEQLATTARTIASRIYAAYLPAFLDPERGFPVDAIQPPGNEPNGTYPRYGLFPLHNPFGAWLLRPSMGSISRFLSSELVRPDGIRMVPAWDAHAGTETVTRDCWFLHFDLYTLKVFRRAGDGAAIENWLRLADSYFARRGVIPELQMLRPAGEGGPPWVGPVGQIWQLFALSGWARGLLEGVAGLETDLGGLTHVPCDIGAAVHVRGLPFRGGSWDVDITGRGPGVVRFAVDGEEVRGSLKVPGELYAPGAHRLEVVRGSNQAVTPCILEAVGGALLHPKVEGDHLTAGLEAWGSVNLLFRSPSRPRVLLDEQPMAASWDPATCTGTCDLLLRGHGELVIEVYALA